MFGRYRLISVIGQGAMGTVYRARDTEIGRDVAIKVLTPQLANEPGYEQRFRREAYTAARLTEPHIIPIYDTGEIDGRLYLVMPIIEGTDVDALLRREGPVPPERAVGITEQLAAALDAAHAAGLVHRDVKPSNTLVTPRDFVYLIDFGIAHDSSATKLTRTGMMVGTMAYMAPERFSTGIADARSDVYALACVLHECLTGELPFPGNSVEQQIAAHLSLDPPRPSRSRPGLPAALDDVIATGMAKNPDARYQSAAALAAAARQALTVPSIPSVAVSTRRHDRPPPPPPRLQPPPRSQPSLPAPPPQRRSVEQPAPQTPRRPMGLIVVIAGLAATLIAVIVVSYQLFKPEPAATQTPTAQVPFGSSTAPSTGQPAEPTTAIPLASTPYIKVPGVATCQIDGESVVCQSTWSQAPVVPCPGCPEEMHMDQAIVDPNGNLTWRDANLGTPDGPGGPGWFSLWVSHPYRGFGWTAQADGNGHATFTNDATGHGMKITWVTEGNSGHAEVATF
ncbi:serine/threonine protein kinase [Mycobacterium intermedium]|nr:serine/threonine-protein kinase [Mycobacterium intermedium]MCV6962503.1 serine/threonine protein kinase [Mycobacterium intermedium]